MEKFNTAQFVYIIDGVRTPIGSAHKSLKDFDCAFLGAVLIRQILRRNRLSGKIVDEVIFGNAVGAGQGQNLARQAAIQAGLPARSAAYTVNHVCAGGLTSVVLGAQSLLSGYSQFVLAGGVESASLTPDLIFHPKQEKDDQKGIIPSLQYDGLYCQLSERHMGELCEELIDVAGISRRLQDTYAFQSHRKAYRAQRKKKFFNEIIPLRIDHGQVLNYDERLRKHINRKRLTELPAAFMSGGTVTAGNSSSPGDGAALVALARDELVKKLKIKPLARVVSWSLMGVEPQKVFTASIPCIKQCLQRAGLRLKDIDLFEIDEAFAAQAIFTQKRLNIPSHKMNIYGGDLALGHPLGAAGARILVTLLHALVDLKKDLGLACVCLGGGGAVSVIIQRIPSHR